MSARQKKFKDAKDKRDAGGFLPVPHVVLNGAAYLGLSAYARMLLFDIAAQYNGDNNGDLCAPWKLMRPRGWKSEATLDKCKRELLESGLIAETRKGARPNKCSLFGLTWFACDDCKGKLDIKPQNFPRGAYKLKDPLPAINSKRIASLNTAGGVARAR